MGALGAAAAPMGRPVGPDMLGLVSGPSLPTTAPHGPHTYSNPVGENTKSPAVSIPWWVGGPGLPALGEQGNCQG